MQGKLKEDIVYLLLQHIRTSASESHQNSLYIPVPGNHYMYMYM